MNVYTDSQYAFAMLHGHGVLYREGGLLTANGKDIKNKKEILTLLDTVWSPTEIAVMHCRGHQKEDTPQAQENRLTRPPDGQQRTEMNAGKSPREHLS